MGLSGGFLHGSSIATIRTSKNLPCMRQRLSSARLWRQRLVSVTNAVAVTASTAATTTTESATATSTILARYQHQRQRQHLHRPTCANLVAIAAIAVAAVAETTTTTTTTTRTLPALAALPTGRVPAPAPQSGSQKPCIFCGARSSLLPTHADDYYTTTCFSSSAALPALPVLLTPRKTVPHVSVSARVSSSSARSSFLSSRNLNSFQVQSSLFHQPGSLRSFSTSPSTMTAIKVDGTAIAKSIREKLAAEVVEKQKLNPQYQPSLKIIQG
ncbi:hypothetical protein GGR51DRAFT_302416 [Nemania sp. FL0031]|nr:hypothetical protein GGR51DRAFT_302416 [Nemania sp. FL0031]